MSLEEDIVKAINYHSRENASDTPDYILGQYLMNCLQAYELAIQGRARHAGDEQPVPPKPNSPINDVNDWLDMLKKFTDSVVSRFGADQLNPRMPPPDRPNPSDIRGRKRS